MENNTENKKFYVTTPIYYVTAKPHLGSLYATLLADVLARWQKLNGKQVHFVTGTDEHGQKVAQAAQLAGKDPQQFVDDFIPAYKQAWDTFNIKYDTFIRTTDSMHIYGAQQFVKRLLAKDAIYKSEYTGWYCTPCETFVTESAVSSNGPLCPSCARQTTFVSEQSYFFRLSAYQEKLLALYAQNPDFIIPKERAQEVISFVQSGLKDLSISRTTVKWGVPFPDDAQHTIYVWVEALCNYITAIGYPDNQTMFEKWWPADVHVLGKDIVKFHAAYWPALLMAADLPVPKKLLVHGWIKVNQQKMSKSFGNAVDPLALYEAYGADAVRYYLLRMIPVNQDGEFSIQDLEQRIASDLANDLGNLFQRMVAVAHKNNIIEVSAPAIWSDAALQLRGDSWDMIEDFQNSMNDCAFHIAIARVWKFINQANGYFHKQEPWKVAARDTELFKEILCATAHGLRTVAVLLWPVMPDKMVALLDGLGIEFNPHNNTINNLELESWHASFLLKRIEPLFIKPEIKQGEPESSVVSNSALQKVAPASTTHEEKKMAGQTQHSAAIVGQLVTPEPAYITIDDLTKVELVVGTIVACEIVENSDKLLKMQVDFGARGMRQILAGIRKSYTPDSLMGSQGLFVYNLKPRKMAGTESQGMMLVAHDEQGNSRIMQPVVAVPAGTRLQ